KMQNKISPETIQVLKRELQQVRKASLTATRTGDFMKVARLTTVAAQLNKSIMDIEGQLLAQEQLVPRLFIELNSKQKRGGSSLLAFSLFRIGSRNISFVGRVVFKMVQPEWAS